MVKIQMGFTLVELLVAVAIIGVLAAIAYPNYQKYIISTNRADMMTELQNRGRTIETRKLAMGHGGYAEVSKSIIEGDYPVLGTPLYTVTVSDIGVTGAKGNWTLTATPKANASQSDDGTLTLRYDGYKCRANTCGMGDEWRK